MYSLTSWHSGPESRTKVRTPAVTLSNVSCVFEQIRKFWATVCTSVSLSHTVVCLSYPVLSVTLMYCGQTVGWISMQLGTEVGLGRGHIVLDGDPALPTKRATAAPTFEIYVRRLVNRGRCLLWPYGWMNQAATWYLVQR